MNSTRKSDVSTSRRDGARVFAAFWQLARPRTCLVSVLAYAFGMEVTGGEWGQRPALGLLVALLIPAVANLHNSYTDIAEDGHNLPGRIALVRVIGLSRLRAAVISGMAVMIGLAAWMGLAQLSIAVVGAALLISYSAPPIRAKARPFLGLVVFSLVVAIPFFAGATVGDEWLTWRSPWTLLTLGWLVFLTLFFIAKGVVKNVPDLEGDRAAGLRTSATLMGSPRRAALAAVVATWLVCVLFPVMVFLTDSPRSMYAIVLWLPVPMWHVTRLLRKDDASYLNSVLKWDMVVSVITLALLPLLARGSTTSLWVVAGCLVVLIGADAIGADSRAPQHLTAPPAGGRSA